MIDVSNDPRIDPRIKTVLGALGTPGGGGDAESREQLLAEASTDEAIAQRAMITTLLGAADNEDDRAVEGPQRDRALRRVAARRQHDQRASHPARRTGLTPRRVLHPRRRHADDVVLRRQLPRVGPHHRRPRRRRRDGRLSQRAHTLVSRGGGAVPRRAERLRLRSALAHRRTRPTSASIAIASSSPARAAAATSRSRPGSS